MAGEPPSRKESGLHSRDRIEQAHRLQVVEVGHKVVCKRVYEVERILLILTPQKWGVIIVQKGKKNILII